MWKVGISPLDALAKYYDGEEWGAQDGDFIRNEKRRGLKLPAMLREFLHKYGYLDVNAGESQFWLPDKIDFDKAKVDGELKDILLIGGFRRNLMAILVEDCETENPPILLDDLPEEDGEEMTLVFHKSEFRLRDVMEIMLMESPAIYHNPLSSDDPAEIQAALETEGLKELARKGKTEHAKRIICWNAEKKSFLVLILCPEREILVKFSPGFSPRELEGMLNRELYENTKGSDYKHALKLDLMLVAFLEKRSESTLLAEKYMLAGRCLWALKKWDEAEEWYKKAERVFARQMKETLAQCQSFYEGYGNFCLAKEDIFKSQLANREVDRIADFLGDGGPRNRGNRFLRQAATMLEIEKVEKAIEYYDKALAAFQETPKECKYEIARCQQLRGEARKKLKLAKAK